MRWVPLTVSLTVSHRRALERLAERKRVMSLSEYVRQLIYEQAVAAGVWEWQEGDEERQG